MKTYERNGRWYRELQPHETVQHGDYISDVPPETDHLWAYVEGSVGKTVAFNVARWQTPPRYTYLRECDVLLVEMLKAKGRNS